jgi:hypothetical protein
VVQVPPGLDLAGFWQPSNLNVDLTLLAAPTATVQVDFISPENSSFEIVYLFW